MGLQILLIEADVVGIIQRDTCVDEGIFFELRGAVAVLIMLLIGLALDRPGFKNHTVMDPVGATKMCRAFTFSEDRFTVDGQHVQGNGNAPVKERSPSVFTDKAKGKNHKLKEHCT